MSAVPLGAAEGEQTFVCRPKPAARFRVDAGRLERRPFRAAEGEQTFVCRPKPAARFRVDAGRTSQERPLALFISVLLSPDPR